jgi:hypothetical protein
MAQLTEMPSKDQYRPLSPSQLAERMSETFFVVDLHCESLLKLFGGDSRRRDIARGSEI